MPFSEALQALQQDHVYGVSLNRHLIQPLLLDFTKSHNAADGRNLNALIVHAGLASDSLLCDHLIRFFTANGSLLEASIIFSSISNPTVYTWNFIISAYSSFGEGQRAIELFYAMQHYTLQPDKVIFLCILRTCSMLGALDQGKLVHELARRAGFGSDLAVGSTLVDMYAKCGDQAQAKVVFKQLTHKDVFSWNALMSGYLQHGDARSCLELHEKFRLDGFQPDRVTFLCLLKAHALVKSLGKCYLLHSEIVITGLDVDSFIGTTLVDMYAKLERLEEARRVFDSLSNRTAVSWNTLLSAYAQQGDSEFAFKMFDTMKVDGINQHESSWNTLISGFVQRGEGVLALSVFERMQCEGTKT
ncbi:hypothetical protein L7F22_053421 [Adiantum nelumboides]|nr:hypothetical protein [Adiantum nelumboides]